MFVRQQVALARAAQQIAKLPSSVSWRFDITNEDGEGSGAFVTWPTLFVSCPQDPDDAPWLMVQGLYPNLEPIESNADGIPNEYVTMSDGIEVTVFREGL